MTTQVQPNRPSGRDLRVAELCGQALAQGSLMNEGYALRISSQTPQVWVWSRKPEALVAYSSTEADRLSSIEEFVSDFFA